MSWSVTLGGQAKNTARLLLETLPSVLLTDRSDPRVVTDALTLALSRTRQSFKTFEMVELSPQMTIFFDIGFLRERPQCSIDDDENSQARS